MKREEKQRNMGKKARRIRGRGIKEPVFRDITTNEDGEEQELNSQETMVPVIAESNRLRQKQCTDTPFMSEPLIDEFGYLAEESVAQQVIDGTYIVPEGTNEYVTDFIHSLKMPNSVKKWEKVSIIVTPEENKQGWKKMKERTAGAYGNIGFGHYIACSQTEDLNEIDTFL